MIRAVRFFDGPLFCKVEQQGDRWTLVEKYDPSWQEDESIRKQMVEALFLPLLSYGINGLTEDTGKK